MNGKVSKKKGHKGKIKKHRACFFPVKSLKTFVYTKAKILNIKF